MGAAHHDDVAIGLGFGCECIAQQTHRRRQDIIDLFDNRDVHYGWEPIVGRLATVYVVVWVNRLLAADHTAGKLDGAIGDDLVRVHVGLGARAVLWNTTKGKLMNPTCRR